MPKIFSDEEKEAHRSFLLDNGLRLIMEKGYKHVTVDQLIQMLGVSKGYFYILFPSKEEFFLDALAWQMNKNFETLRSAVENGQTTLEIGQVYQGIFRGMHFATFEDVIYVQQKVSEQQWQHFRDFEEEFFTRVLELFGKNTVSKCDPKIVSNLSALIFLAKNSHAKYLFSDKMDDVINILLNTFHIYIFGEEDSIPITRQKGQGFM